ncbi:HAMP domain-containing sensor histidine kinase [Lagierella sp. ICN-221743]
MKQANLDKEMNFKVDMKLVLKRMLVALLILAISTGTGIFFYKNYGQLSEDEVIPYYLNNGFGSYTDNKEYGNYMGDYYNTDLFIDYYFKYGDFYPSDSMGHPIEKVSSGEEMPEDAKPEDYSVLSNIKEKTIDGFESYYNDNDFVFLSKGHIKDGKLVFEGKELKKEYKKAIIPIVNNYMSNTIYENQTRYIPKSSPDFNDKKFHEMQGSNESEIEYIYADDGNEVVGVNIKTPKYKTAKLESFNIGMTKDKYENNPIIKHPTKLVFSYGFLPGIAVMAILFLIYDSFSDFDKYKNLPVIRAFRKTPIEIKILFWVGLILISGVGLNYPVRFGDINFINISYISSMASLMLFSFAVILIERSIILQIKLIYRNGFKEGFLENSLIVNGFSITKDYSKVGVKKLSKKIKTLQGDIGEYSLGKIVAIVAIFLILMLIGQTLEVSWLLTPAIAYIIGKVIYTWSRSISKINKQSSLIAEGNFDEKVDEDIPHFQVIAKNFNTIGDNINKSVEEKVKAERLKTDLIANVSHDLKTPLTSIISYSSLLKEEDTPEEMKEEYVDIIYEKATKLNNLIEDLFQISKITSNSIHFNKEKIDIVAFINQVTGEFRDEFDQKGMKLILNEPEYPIYCLLDGQKTYRVFENLITNILKYSQDNTRVYITLDDGGDKIRITLKNISKFELDISPEELQQRFIRADKSRNTEGNGLGLSIATSFVEGQGGVFNMEIDGDLFKTIIYFKKFEE